MRVPDDLLASAGGAGDARPQPPHHHRNKCQDAKCHKRSHNFGRDRGPEVEIEPAVRSSRRHTGLIGGLLRGHDAVEAGAHEREGEGRRNHAEHTRGHEGRKV